MTKIDSYKNILVTGGAGFMGSNFIRYLYNKYPTYKIFNADLLTYAGNLENLADLEGSERYEFRRGDICDRVFLEELFSKNNFEVVVNFAAESHVDRSIRNASHFVKTNIFGLYMLLEIVRKYKTPRFIHISTDEVYGDIPLGVKTPEDYPFSPSSPYAASKASGDLLVQSFMRTHKLPAIIIRSSNNFGPYQYPEKLHAIAITSMLEGQKLPLHGRGDHIRSWIHVEDFCEAVDLIMHRSGDYKIYNIAGEEKTNMEIIAAVASVLDKNHLDHIEFINDRPGADFRYSPDCTKISKELGWERKRSYQESVADLAAWYRVNQAWWEKTKQKIEYMEYYDKQMRGEYDLPPF